MKRPIFLSASVPNREPFVQYFDAIAIREAVLSLVATEARERQIVFGGHPAISPLVEHAARSLGALNQIHIYQSKFFEAFIPEVAKEFPNLHWTKRQGEGEGNRDASLTLMRREMISSGDFCAAVFVGGMEGIFEEWSIFSELHPHAAVIPIASTGGAAQDVFEKMKGGFKADAQMLLRDENRYRRVFAKLLPRD